jgi:hypothetical protein
LIDTFPVASVTENSILYALKLSTRCDERK